MGEFPQEFGRYQLIERLAVGGMAELFLAQAAGVHGFERRVVVKRLLPHMTADAHFNAMFIDEAKLTARLSHPKIAQTYELGSVDGQLFIAMEYIEGLDALAVLRECAHRRQRLPPEICVWVGHEVLDALDFAHNQVDAAGNALGIIHRDISPSNVIMSRRGDVKLVDFGIARAIEQHHKTKSGTLKGKYGYMSPEQVTGQPVDGRSDLFSAGILLAEMLTGRRLFAAPNELDVLLMVRDASLARLERFGKHLDESILVIVRKCLSKNPDHRYQTAAEFRDVLSDWLFEQRHRVTPSAVSEIVESLYADARERRRAGLQSIVDGRIAAAATNPASAAPVPPASAPVHEPAPAGEPREPSRVVLDPQQLLAGSSGLPSAIEDATSETPSGSHSLPSPTIETPGTPFPDASIDDIELEPAGGAGGSGSFSLDLETSGDAEVDAALSRLAASFASPDASVTASGDRRVARAEEEADPDLGFKRYPSMQEALDSLEPQTLDPTARDYDDSPVTETQHVRTVSGVNLPSPDSLRGVEPPKPPRIDEIEGAPDHVGSFADASPIAVLYRLALAGETGLLTASVGAVRKDIYFAAGTPEFVASNVASELFGAYLVAHNAISEGELAMTLAMMPHFGGKLGDTLVGLGLMKPLDVFRLLTQQVREKLIDVCTWSKGEYGYYRGRTNPRESFPLDLDAFEVLGAGAMAAKHAVVASWAEQHSAAAPRSLPIGDVALARFKLGTAGRQVYDRLRGDTSLADLRSRYTDTELELRFLRVLKLLVDTGFATL